MAFWEKSSVVERDQTYADTIPGSAVQPPSAPAVVEAPVAAPAPEPAYQDTISGEDAQRANLFRQAYGSMSPEQQAELKAVASNPSADPLRAEAISSVLESKAIDIRDQSQEEEFLRLANRFPANVATEARRYWIAKPHLSFEYIAQNLDKIRAQVQAENLPWDVIRDQHPLLRKYLADPSTATQALSESAMLTGVDRILGGFVEPIGGPLIKIDEKTGKPFAATPLPSYTAPPWLAAAKAAFTKDVPMFVKGAGVTFQNFTDWAFPSTHIDAVESARKEARDFWMPAYQRAARDTTGTIDFLGPAPEGEWYSPAKIARTVETGVTFVTRNSPMLLGAAVSGGLGAAGKVAGSAEAAIGATRGVFMFNTAYSALETYPRLKELTGDTGLSLALSLGSAPAMGKIMGWNPISNAAGATLFKHIELGVGRAAAKAVEQQSWRTLARISVMKGGADFLAGSLAFMGQNAATAGLEQGALALSGKEADIGAIYKSINQGWEDWKSSWLMSLFGTSRHLVSDVGRMIRAKDMATRVEAFKEEITKVTSDPSFREEAVGAIAAQPGRDKVFFLPLQRFNEIAKEAGLDPREAASGIYGDGGAEYDRATGYYKEHLAIPVEKMGVVFGSRIFGDFAVNEGTFDREIMSRVVANKISKEFSAAFEAALKLKPEEMTDNDKAIFAAITDFAKSDEEASKMIFAKIQALSKRHVTLTAQEIFDALWGKGGLYGPKPEANGARQEFDIGSPMGDLVYTHDKMPEKLHIRLDMDIATGEPVWTVSDFGFPAAELAKHGSLEGLKKAYGGKGYATDIYLLALRDAQMAKTAWLSDDSRLPVTVEMYARLRKYGVPFKLVKDRDLMGKPRYYLSREELAAVDFDKIDQRRRELATPVVERLLARLKLKKSVSASPQAMLDAREAAWQGLKKWKAEKGITGDSLANDKATVIADADLPAGWTRADAEILASKVADAEALDALVRTPRESDAYGMPTPAEQALRVAIDQTGVYDSKEWAQALKTEADSFAHAAEIADMQKLARQRIEVAIKSGVRAQVTEERKKFEAKAREEIKTDLSYRAQHFFQTGELWGDNSRVAMLTGEDGRPLRLLDTDVDSLMGVGFAEALKESKKGLITSDPEMSVDVDAAANALGFTGSAVAGEPARRMLTGLRDALSESQFAKQWADLKMQEALRSDLIDNPQALVLRVMDAVQNEKLAATLLHRIRVMGNSLDPARSARSLLPAEAWAEIASNIVASKTLGDLKPQQHVQAMKEASVRALKAIKEGRMDAAWDATEAQLLHHYMYRQSRESEKSITHMYDRLAANAESDRWKATLGKADPAYRNLAVGLMGAVGIGEAIDTSKAMDSFMEAVTKNSQLENLAMDTDGGWDSSVVASLMAGNRKWEDLRPSEAAEVFKAIKNIMHIAKAQTEVMKAIDSAQTYGLINSAERYLSGLRPGVEGPVLHGPHNVAQDTRAEVIKALDLWKQKAASMGWNGAYLDSPRVILGYLGEDVQKKIYGGFMAARVTEAELLKSLYEPWKETQKIWERDTEFNKPLIGVEDSHLLKTSQLDENGNPKFVEVKGARIHGLDGPLTKRYLIQMVKWLGSESGRKKLLDGMDLNLDAVLELAGRYLQPHEVDAIQAEHRFFDEKLAPLKAAAWERRTGLPWERVTPMGYEIKFGDGITRKYDGGYYPVHWDKREGVDKGYIPVQPNKFAGMNPKVPDGSFRERRDFVGVPDLNWDNIPAHLLSDVHNLAFGDFVQETNRVLLSPHMKNVMLRHLGPEYAAWPRQWLERVANESSGHVSGHLEGLNKFTKYARSAVTTAYLGFRLPLLAGDMSHPLATALMRDNVAMSITYAAPSMGRVLSGAAEFLITGSDPLRAEIESKSAIVRLRANELPSQMMRWYHGTYEKSAEPGFWESALRARDAINNVSFWHLRVSDGLVTRMIWDAKYRYVLDQTGDEAKAVAAADEQVMAAMPDYNVMATPSILAEGGRNFAAVGLMFHSYWSKLLEMSDERRHKDVILPNRIELSETGTVSPMSKAVRASFWAGRTMAMLTFGAVIGDFLQGQGKRNDEDWQTWLIRKELSAPFKLLPYASMLTEPSIAAASSKRGERAQKISISIPHFRPFERMGNAINAMVFDRRKPDDDKVFDLVESSLMFMGLPASAPTDLAQYSWKLGTGKVKARGLGDMLGGGIYGKKYGRLKRYNTKDPFTQIQDIFEEGSP